MAIFVTNNSIVKVRSGARRCISPHIHLHSWRTSIWWCTKVCIVRTAAVQSIGIHVVGSKGTIAIVIFLKISALLVESILIEHIVKDVIPIE